MRRSEALREALQAVSGRRPHTCTTTVRPSSAHASSSSSSCCCLTHSAAKVESDHPACRAAGRRTEEHARRSNLHLQNPMLLCTAIPLSALSPSRASMAAAAEFHPPSSTCIAQGGAPTQFTARPRDHGWSRPLAASDAERHTRTPTAEKPNRSTYLETRVWGVSGPVRIQEQNRTRPRRRKTRAAKSAFYGHYSTASHSQRRYCTHVSSVLRRAARQSTARVSSSTAA